MKELELPELDFFPVPANKRRSPGRVRSIPARLYVERFQEHKKAYEFLQEVQKLYGAGTKTLVRSLLYWRDSVTLPLEKYRDDMGRLRLPSEYRFAVEDFTPIADGGGAIKHISARLYVDKWIEHREAYEFIQLQQRLHGEGVKTIVRAVNHYEDALKKAQKKAGK